MFRTITISKYASREELLQSAMKAFVVTQVPAWLESQTVSNTLSKRTALKTLFSELAKLLSA